MRIFREIPSAAARVSGIIAVGLPNFPQRQNGDMTKSLGGSTTPPDDAMLEQALGTSKNVWDGIIDHIDKLPNGLARTWKFYGTKYGWQMKVTDGKRAVLYLVPHEGSFLAALALNDTAVAALRSQKIPSRLLREITTGKTYPEGRPARIEVTSRRDLAVVKKLLGIKLRAHSRSQA